MPLRKATQSVISPNICTTDTAQTITGNKIFSNANVTGVASQIIDWAAHLEIIEIGY